MVSRARKPARPMGTKGLSGPPPGSLRLFDTVRYGGQWVATRRGVVLAHGPTFGEVDAAVRRLGVENEVILTRVPRSGEVLL